MRPLDQQQRLRTYQLRRTKWATCFSNVREASQPSQPQTASAHGDKLPVASLKSKPRGRDHRKLSFHLSEQGVNSGAIAHQESPKHAQSLLPPSAPNRAKLLCGRTIAIPKGKPALKFVHQGRDQPGQRQPPDGKSGRRPSAAGRFDAASCRIGCNQKGCHRNAFVQQCWQQATATALEGQLLVHKVWL